MASRTPAGRSSAGNRRTDARLNTNRQELFMSTLHEPRLQIDPRCIKCGKSPTADTSLLEMQNHLYICNDCRQDEERKGKKIAWADGSTTPPTISVPSSPRQPGVNN